MAMKWEKFSKPVERRKPIIFLINESATEPGSSYSGMGCCCERGVIREAVSMLLTDFKKNNVRADIAVVTFGNTVNLLLPYTDITKINIGELTNKITKLPVTNAAVFGTGLLAVKEFLEDLDETPKQIYRPTVILITSNEPSRGWESCLETFLKDGRSSKSQRLAIFTPINGRITQTFDKGIVKKTPGSGDQLEQAFKQIRAQNGAGLSEAVKAYAEKGVALRCESYPSGNWVQTMTNWLSFDELEEEAPMVEVEKPEDDIPVLKDADFDGNNLDMDSFI